MIQTHFTGLFMSATIQGGCMWFATHLGHKCCFLKHKTGKSSVAEMHKHHHFQLDAIMDTVF
jgi:hypothetical protein